MLRELRTSLLMLVVLTLVTGVLYPLLVAGIGRVAFAGQAGGSLIRSRDRVIGSALVGQAFADSTRFWSRPSATAVPYDAGASSGSNRGPMHPALLQAIADRVAALRAADPGNTAAIPTDLVTASGSGLDPHISPAAAGYQVGRVARARGIEPERLRALVTQHTEPRTLGVLGEPRVNVLKLNLALEGLASPPDRP